MPKKPFSFTQQELFKWSCKIDNLTDDKSRLALIDWTRVAWAIDMEKNRYSVRHTEDKQGMCFYLHKPEGPCLITKRDLAYAFDLYSQDGELLNIMWLGL